jgi:hypothetical protein
MESVRPAYELWPARGKFPLIRLCAPHPDSELIYLTQRLADICRRPIVLYRVPFCRPLRAPPWPRNQRERVHRAKPDPTYMVAGAVK